MDTKELANQNPAKPTGKVRPGDAWQCRGHRNAQQATLLLAEQKQEDAVNLPGEKEGR